MSNPEIGTHDKDKYFNEAKRAAENNDKEAQYKLASLYRKGEGTEKSLEKAFYWYQKAAENGIGNAKYDLSVCYYDGVGTEKNLEKAFDWYRKAIETAPITIDEDDEYDKRRAKSIESMMRSIMKPRNKSHKICDECHMRRRRLREDHQICVICY